LLFLWLLFSCGGTLFHIIAKQKSIMYEATVVGGGTVSLSTAYHLVVHGVRTLLLDRTDQGQATQGAAGIVSPDTYTTASETWEEQ
jgi:glycine/D-amino acid oxidase-like deaminating enzyme